MDLAPSQIDGFISREDYRSWCERQPCGRFERVDGRIVRMAAERVGHLRAKAAVYVALRRAVRAAGVPCEALPDGATVETGDSDFEPDALVNCGQRMGDAVIASSNPVIVVEVLSPGMASVDTGLKLVGYFRVDSIAHYLIVDPSRRVILHHRRTADGIATSIVVSGPIAMDPPGLVITVEEIYDATEAERPPP